MLLFSFYSKTRLINFIGLGSTLFCIMVVYWEHMQFGIVNIHAIVAPCFSLCNKKKQKMNSNRIFRAGDAKNVFL